MNPVHVKRWMSKLTRSASSKANGMIDGFIELDTNY